MEGLERGAMKTEGAGENFRLQQFRARTVMAKHPVVPSSPSTIHFALASSESLAHQLDLARRCHERLAAGSAWKGPLVAPTRAVKAYADWYGVWNTELETAREEDRPMRLSLWHGCRAEETEGVPIPYCLEDRVIRRLGELYSEVPTALKTPSDTYSLACALQRARPLLEIEGVVFCIIVTCKPGGRLPKSPWARLIQQAHNDSISNDSDDATASSNSSSSGDGERHKGKAQKGKAKEVKGRKGKAKKVKGKAGAAGGSARESTTALRGMTRIEPTDASVLQLTSPAKVAPLEVFAGQACDECVAWDTSCSRRVWDKPEPCRNITTIGTDYLQGPKSTTLAFLSFILLNAPTGLELRLEQAIYRHGGSVTSYVCAKTTHILVFGKLSAALDSQVLKDVRAIDEKESKNRGGERRWIRVVTPEFLLSCIYHSSLPDWKQYNLATTIAPSTFDFFDKPPSTTQQDW